MATLHGIHHADRRELEYSNLSSGLTLWDVLHAPILAGSRKSASPSDCQRTRATRTWRCVAC